MEITQSELEHLLNKVALGELTPEQANIEKIKMKRVHLVTCSIPLKIRRTLSAAVKRGELGHVKKDGRKPEAFYHPSFEYLVAGERNAHERSLLTARSGVLV